MPKIDLSQFVIGSNRRVPPASDQPASTGAEGVIIESVDYTTTYPQRVAEAAVALDNQLTADDALDASAASASASQDVTAHAITPAPIVMEPPTIESQLRIPMGPLRQVDWTRVAQRWQVMEQLCKTIPLNSAGLPQYIYRPDMIDIGMFHEHVIALTEYKEQAAGHNYSQLVSSAQTRITCLQEMLEAATTMLNYSEGFPAVEGGEPFWMLLPFETSEDYGLFMSFLECGGARKMADVMHAPIATVRAVYHTNYWAYRAKAFDAFQVVHHQKLRIQRVLKTEDSHYRIADRLLAKMETYFQEFDPLDEKWDLQPAKAVEIVDRLVKIQRISIGLGANGPTAIEAPPIKMPDVHIMMQQVAQLPENAGPKEENPVDLLLESPENVELAQELILRMGQTTLPAPMAVEMGDTDIVTDIPSGMEDTSDAD